MIEEIDDLVPKNAWAKELARKNVSGNNAIIVDVQNFCYRYKQRGQTQFGEDLYKTMQSLAKSYSGKHIFACWDFRSSAYRKSLFEGYKGKRKVLAQQKTDTEKAQDEMFFQGIRDAYQYCMEMEAKEESDITNFRFEFVEADDLIAYTVQILSPHFDHLWVISTDQDFCQLISDKVSLFAYKSRKEFTLDTMFEYTNADSAEQHLFIKCLQGDEGDSVPGVQDIGPKRGYALAREYGDIFNLIDHLPISGKQKFIQRLNDFGADRLLLNMELMDLKTYCQTAIAFPDPDNIDYMKLKFRRWTRG